jgi:methylthioribose-1-phosphate isomerase
MIEASRWNKDHMEIVDQRQLPDKVAVVRMETLDQVEDAIRTLKIRGAPAIGVAAGYGVVVGIRNLIRGGALNSSDVEGIFRRLRATRPTAINLFWALERMRKVVDDVGLNDGDGLVKALLQEAIAIHQEDKELCRKIGEHGAEALPEGGILTHCHAGALATGGIGTAVGVIRTAHEMGKEVHVYVDETRPLLQGARLTAWELEELGIPVTLICDNMAASLMSKGKIQAVIVGADRIAANGDTANKIGTYSVAVAAKYHGIPFLVAAPYSTIDRSVKCGAEIPIEERDADEVRGYRDARWAPKDIPVWNPAFDVTPASLITAIITEAGVHIFPYHFET